MNREPLITVASITAAVVAVLSLLTAFGMPLTDDQRQAILGVVAVAAPLVVGLVARAKVTPNGSVIYYNDANGGVTAGEAANESTEIPSV